MFIPIIPLTGSIFFNFESLVLTLSAPILLKPKLLIIVDFAGHPCRLNKIKNLSKKYRFKILQDSSHALGAKYENSKIGNCKYSDLTVFSFHPVKTITTGEGGIITTNEKNIYNKLARLRSHGIVREKKFLLKKKLPKWYYEQVDLGFNYRMTDIQSALGVSQLKKINMFIKKRNQIAARYNLLLKGLPVILPKKTHKVLSTYHLYVIRVDNKIIKRDKLYNEFIKNNIGVNLHYIPIHKQPFYKKYLKKKVYLPNAEKYYKTALSLPIHPKLTFSDLERIVKIIKKSIKR